jgi:hypothetical protein
MGDTFRIPDTNCGDVPITQLHYYKWLETYTGDQRYYITVTRTYLQTLGFKLGVDKLNLSDIQTLRTIYKFWWDNTQAPTKTIH